ncbi:MAG: MotA/TolQ/ExbB proton channel family protein [Gammaproteobacteria bacterium]|nr:MAG: MotA/TolQ/ExbB proton channel family protein [Gammaproteobacteria bacterium]
MYSELVTFFQTGGPFMYPILFVFAFGIAIAIERYIYLTALKLNNRRLLSKIVPILQQGNLQEVYQITSRSKVAICQMLNLGITTLQSSAKRDEIEMAMEEGLMEIIPRLEKRTHYLAMFANIATLLGLLGTITGLIKAFTAVAQVDPSLKAEILSSSISVAMNTTAFGLAAAIPLIIIFSILQSKTTEIVDSLEMANVKFVNLIMRKK